uniref:Uncharacterized protein n=1 Tax=Anguilla anguilla TaxID=7936 RepID=A0A0E9U4D8_ANGAN
MLVQEKNSSKFFLKWSHQKKICDSIQLNLST